MDGPKLGRNSHLLIQEKQENVSILLYRQMPPQNAHLHFKFKKQVKVANGENLQ